MSKAKIEQIIKILFYTYLLCVFVVHVMKADDFKTLNEYLLGIRIDHWLHAILFLPLGILINYVLKNRNHVILIVLFSCVFFETLQYFLPYRSFEFTDILSDTTGVILGLLIYFLSRNLITHVLFQNQNH